MEMEWPLILFTFFVCLASGILLGQGVMTVLGKGKSMQLASLVSSLVALAVGGISVFFHLQHWERIFNGFGHITSGITLEFIGCVVFFVVLVVYFLMMRRAEDGMAPKWCGVLAIIMGVAMPAITGDSYLMEAIPVWDTFLLPVYYVFNAVFFGGLSVLVIAALTKCDDVNDTAIWLAIGGGVATAVALIAYAVFINSLGGVYSDITYYFDPTLPDSSMIDVQEDFVGTVLAGSNASVLDWRRDRGRCASGGRCLYGEARSRGRQAATGPAHGGRWPGLRSGGRYLLAHDPLYGRCQHLRPVLKVCLQGFAALQAAVPSGFGRPDGTTAALSGAAR